MAFLPDLQREQQRRAELGRKAYERVCAIRKNLTEDEVWRIGQAGLEWLADYLLEGKAFLRECILDGSKLKIPGRRGEFNSMNGGYNFGFDIEPGRGNIVFPLYAMDLDEGQKHLEIYQCPKCKLVYSLPREIDVKNLRRQTKPEPMVFGEIRTA